MPTAVNLGLLFLINTLFDFYLYILMIRIILVYVHAHYFHPFTQFIVKCTDFIIKPLRRIIPNYGRLENASILLLLILAFIKYLLIFSISSRFPNLLGVLIVACGDGIKILLQTFFYAIIFEAILSWIQPWSELSRLLYQFNAPIMQPFRRLIPPIANIDISPIAALIVLQLLLIVLVNPLMMLGLQVALSS